MLLLAVSVYDDYTDFGVYGSVHKRGIQIPTDLSVMGSDDMFYAKFLNPPLTTLNISYCKVGTLVAKTLLRILMKDKRVKRKIFINPEWKSGDRQLL